MNSLLTRFGRGNGRTGRIAGAIACGAAGLFLFVAMTNADETKGTITF